MRIESVNYSDSSGGAARAAYRIHQAVRSVGLDSSLHVADKRTDDSTVLKPSGKFFSLDHAIRPLICAAMGQLLNRFHRGPSSLSILPSRWSHRLNALCSDVIHLHWLGAEMMSIRDIGRIRGPKVWTLHDMWPLGGLDHYHEGDDWTRGYSPIGLGLWSRMERLTWLRKRRLWGDGFHIAAPSNWMAECVRRSALGARWPVEVIPNPIDTNNWRPVSITTSRELLNLPPQKPLLLFGAMGGSADARKGFDLMAAALTYLKNFGLELEIAVLGQSRPNKAQELGFPVHYMGHLYDDVSLRLLYSAADIMVIPSRMDNLPNTGVEALACGTPIAAFNTCGMPDLVKHRETGWLADPFDPADLARGIRELLDEPPRRVAMRAACRALAIEKFSYESVGSKYRDLYRSAILSSRNIRHE